MSVIRERLTEVNHWVAYPNGGVSKITLIEFMLSPMREVYFMGTDHEIDSDSPAEFFCPVIMDDTNSVGLQTVVDLLR